MKKYLLPILAILALLVVNGCATVEQTGTDAVGNVVWHEAVFTNNSTAQQTPLQTLSDALGKLANNKLLAAVNQDAMDTNAWVDSAQGPTDPLLKFQAHACPTSILLANASIQQTISQMQGLITQLNIQQQNVLSGGNPEIILTLTKLRYGNPGTPGSDPSAMLASLKTTLWAQISAVVDNCRQVIPVKQINDILKQAAAAGLTAGASSALGALP